MDEDHEHESSSQLEANSKRRKVRKGTRSCWDCKRRKMKCSFEGSPSSTEAEVCIGCKKRGSKCVSQEFDIPSELSTPLKRPNGQGRTKRQKDHERVSRVEALLEQLVKKNGNDEKTVAANALTNCENGWNNTGIPTPLSIDSGSSASQRPSKIADVRTPFNV